MKSIKIRLDGQEQEAEIIEYGEELKLTFENVDLHPSNITFASGDLQMPMPTEEDIKHIIYVAYLMNKLADWKYLVYSSRSLEWDIKQTAPANFDATHWFMKLVKKWKPELYDEKKTINEITKTVEEYLFAKPCKESIKPEEIIKDISVKKDAGV